MSSRIRTRRNLLLKDPRHLLCLRLRWDPRLHAYLFLLRLLLLRLHLRLP